MYNEQKISELMIIDTLYYPVSIRNAYLSILLITISNVLNDSNNNFVHPLQSSKMSFNLDDIIRPTKIPITKYLISYNLNFNY